jgi:hypothetical protein
MGAQDVSPTISVDLGPAVLSTTHSGVVHIALHEGAVVDASDVDTLLDGIQEHAGAGPHCLVLDMRRMNSLSRDARFALAGERAGSLVRACAILAAGPMGRVAASFLVRVAHPPYAVRIFQHEGEGVEWLNQQCGQGERPRSRDAAPTVRETRVSYCSISSDRVLRISIKPGADIGVRDAREAIALGNRMVGSEPFCMLVELNRIRSMTREARVAFSQGDTDVARRNQGVAVVVRSPVARIIGNFFIGFNRSSRPVRLFNASPEAEEWLGTVMRRFEKGGQ